MHELASDTLLSQFTLHTTLSQINRLNVFILFPGNVFTWDSFFFVYSLFFLLQTKKNIQKKFEKFDCESSDFLPVSK